MPAYKLTREQSDRKDALLLKLLPGVEFDYDGVYDLVNEVIWLRDEVDSLRAFKAGVDEALNSGDGVYRP